MDTKTFLHRIIPDGGTYFIASDFVGKDGKTGIRNAKANSLDEAVATINRLSKLNKNVFISTGSFTFKDEKNTKRVKENLAGKKCLYLDLDCGPGKDFPNKKAAIVALHEFLKTSGMPKYSLIIDSGNGIHVYWTLEEAIDHEQWSQLASGLKLKCKAHGLNADHTCTSDAVRILRVPGTINFKDPSNTKKCAVLPSIDNGDVPLARLNKILLGATAPTLSVIEGNPVPQGTVDNSDLGGGVKEFTNPPASMVFDKCATMKHALDTGGKDDSQPLWAQQLHVLSYLPDGRDYIHKISDQHPDYTKEETERKFEEKLLVRVNGGTAGPTSCEQFATTGGSQCHQCPYYGKVKNPCLAVNFRMPNELPRGYSMKDDGMYKEVQMEGEAEGFTELVRMSRYRFFDASINCPTGQDTHYFRFFCNIGQSKPKVVELTSTELSDAKQFNGAMSFANITMKPEEAKGVQRLMTTWKQQMEAAKFITHAPNNMGWTEQDDKVGFALSKKILWSDGKETDNPLPNAELLVHYSPTGKLEPWKKAAKLITDHPNTELHVALASSFAAPLMTMTNTHGAVLAIVSSASGVGKSKALHTAQAVWGKPNQINSMDDTGNSMIRKMGILNNLPAYWDELHMQDTNGQGLDSFTNMIFRLAQGKEKTRLTNQIKFQSSGEWTTLITVVSNDSIHDHLRLTRKGTSAAVMRVLELEITDAKRSNGDLTKALMTFGNMDKNYGKAGEVYAKYIVENHERLRKEVVGTIAKISQIKGMPQEERMRIALIAALMVGAKAANDAGLTEFDTKALAARMIPSILPKKGAGKDAPQHMSDMRIIEAYISAHAEHINKTDTFQTRGNNQNVSVIAAPHRLPVRVHIADSLDRVRVEEAHLRDWVTREYGGGSRLVASLRNTPKISECRGSLAFGLPSNTKGRPRLIEMPLP